MNRVFNRSFLLVFAFIAAIIVAAGTTSAIDFSYTTVGFGDSMGDACDNAIARIDSECATHGAVSTRPVGCRWIEFPIGQQTRICRCEATTTACGNPGPGLDPFSF